MKRGVRFNRVPTGQGYLATVSDLTASLVFVLLLLVGVFALRLTTAADRHREVVENHAAEQEVRRRILDEISEHLARSGIDVEVIYDQGVVRLSEDAVNFARGDERPMTEHEPHVGRLAHALSVIVPCYVRPVRPDSSGGASAGSDERTAQPGAWCPVPVLESVSGPCPAELSPWLVETLLIEGHTDAVPVSPSARFADNLALSSMRAASVHRMIRSCRPHLDGLLNTSGAPVLSVSGYGETRPATLDPLATANRRIDLRFLLEPKTPPTPVVSGSAISESVVPVRPAVGGAAGGR